LSGGRGELLFRNALERLLATGTRILDVGTSQRFAKELRPYESLFAEKEYVAAGYEPSKLFGAYNCDCHQDIEKMTFCDGEFDAVLCIEVLEHVADPFAAARELQRVVRPGGRILVTVPFLAQYHGKSAASHSHDAYPDYWRYTHEGLKLIFRECAEATVMPLDGPLEFRFRQFGLDRIIRMRSMRWLIDRLDRPAVGRSASRHLLLATK
jgi:SAM-dependent methyltransferase